MYITSLIFKTKFKRSLKNYLQKYSARYKSRTLQEKEDICTFYIVTNSFTLDSNPQNEKPLRAATLFTGKNIL